MLSRLERAVENVVEGSIAKVFRLRVQPAEIGRRLERAMLDGRVTSVGTALGPNVFEVRLHPDDAQSFADWEAALCLEMETWLAELAFARGIVTVGPIRVSVVEDPSVKRRSVRALARFDAESRPVTESSPSPEPRPQTLKLLPLIKGIPTTTLSKGSLTVGRAEDNDLVVAMPEISRHHARLESNDTGWGVIDLGSTNGTWLNGQRISHSLIDIGDELAFGDVRFTIVAG